MSAKKKRSTLRQGGHQEPDQGRLEDGHLDAAELSRRADFRSDRAQSRGHRQLLHLDRVARRRRRPGGDRARVAAVGIDHAFKSDPESRRRARRRAASINGGAAASSTCTTPTPSPSCSTRCAPAITGCSRITRASSMTTAAIWRRCAACSNSSPSARRCRSRRSSRPARSSSASRPARCPSDRSARKRTKISRSR